MVLISSNVKRLAEAGTKLCNSFADRSLNLRFELCVGQSLLAFTSLDCLRSVKMLIGLSLAADWGCVTQCWHYRGSGGSDCLVAGMLIKPFAKQIE